MELGLDPQEFVPGMCRHMCSEVKANGEFEVELYHLV